jgi:hypothetical protein
LLSQHLPLQSHHQALPPQLLLLLLQDQPRCVPQLQQVLRLLQIHTLLLLLLLLVVLLLLVRLVVCG